MRRAPRLAAPLGRALCAASRRRGASLALALVWLGSAACSVQTAEREPGPTVILVSLDGFPARLLDPAVSPTIARLAAQGVHAPDGIVPVFPTKTFPNHYSIVTGLYTEHHGIVSNSMYDPVFDASFSLGDRAAVSDGRWWGGEPLWVTVETQGRIAGTYFWPGSEAEIGGVRPTYWKQFDGSVPNSARVREVLSWLDLPDDRRPSFITTYFSDVDSEIHRHGVGSAEGKQAMARVDAAVAELVAGLEARGIADQVNLVITADHGMADIAPDRVIFLDDYIDLASVRVSDWSPVAAIWPQEGDEEAVYRALTTAAMPWRVYRKGEIPERFHYRAHRRIAPIIAIADEGWSITTRDAFRIARFQGATHGYDHELASMRALFVARGPAFATGRTVAPFTNIHLYELLAAVLGVVPAANDGSLDSVRTVLRVRPGATP